MDLLVNGQQKERYIGLIAKVDPVWRVLLLRTFVPKGTAPFA